MQGGELGTLFGVDPGSSHLLTRAEAVAALGLASARALDKLIDRGAPAPRPGKRGSRRYDVAALAAWREARGTSTAPTSDLATERAKLAHVQRELSILKLREARGELIRARDAEDAQRAIVAAAKVALLAVSRRAVLEGLPREYEPLIKRLITSALEELAAIKTMAALAAMERSA